VSFQKVWGRGDEWARDAMASGYSARDALALSAVRGCVGHRGRLVGQLPIVAYREGVDGTAVPVSPQPQLVVRPGLSPRPVWLRQYMCSVDLWGNAWGAIAGTDAAGYPTVVEWMDPGEITPDPTSRLPRVLRNGQPFPSEDLLHVAPFVLPGQWVGMAPLERDGLVQLGRLAQQFGRDWFKRGAHPSAIVYSDRTLTEDEAAQVKGRVRKLRRGEPAVFGAGLRYEQVQVNANESQFLETIRAAQVDVCMSFGVPPEALGISAGGSGVTYANREQRLQDYLVTGLNYDLTVLQDVLTDNLRPGEYAKVNTGALLRSDLVTRYQSYEIADRIGLLTIDEMRALEDRPPLGEATDARAGRAVAEAVQKVYLGVGKVITSDEAREIVNKSGGGLDVPGPTFPSAEPPVSQRDRSK
jgi:HK97 family phage portal protein